MTLCMTADIFVLNTTAIVLCSSTFKPLLLVLAGLRTNNTLRACFITLT